VSKILVGKGGVTTHGWHKIESAFRCLKAYQFERVRGIYQPTNRTPDHFAVGIMHHAMRARWFAKGFKTDNATWLSMMDAGREAAEEGQLPITIKAERMAQRHMQAYVQHWSARVLPRPKAAEYLIGPVALKAGDSKELHRTARLDDVSEYPEGNWQLYLGESKTTSTSISDCVRQYELHGQPMLQLALWKMSKKGEARFGPVKGVMLDVTVKSYDVNVPPKFGRVPIPISEYALEWYVKEIRGMLALVDEVGWDTEVSRNVGGCTYMAGRMRVDCAFKELCRFGRSATTKYVLPEGKSLTDKSAWKGETPPWL
jgi:hypothetical protein